MRRALILAALLGFCGAGCTITVDHGPSKPTAITAGPTQAPATTQLTPAATTTTAGQQVLLIPPACATEATGQLEGESCLPVIPTFNDPIPEA